MEKNEKLTIERGISFDEVVELIESGASTLYTLMFRYNAPLS